MLEYALNVPTRLDCDECLTTSFLETGLYRGTTITLIRDVPSHGVYFAAFELGKEWLEPGARANGSRNPFALLAAGF